MSAFAAGQVLLFAAAMFTASVLAMALAWLAACGGRASLRHLVWAVSFGALILLPALALALPGAIVLTVAPPPPSLDMVAATPAPAPLPEAAPPSVAFELGDVARLLIGLWMLGVVLIGLRHLIAAMLLRNMLRDSVEHPFDASELAAASRGLRFNLRLSPRGRGPLTWGIFRPVILLPDAAQFWPHERLQAVLHHEFAHVRRRDGLTQALACAASALYWPNPLVWLGLRALRREAEIAADDAVIASGMTPSDYAGELVRMAKEFRAQGLPAALAMAAPSALPARVQSILAPTQTRSGVTSMDVMKMSAIALLATGVLVAARPSLAQDAPPAPPALATPATPPAMPAAEAVPPAPPQEAMPPAPPVPPSAVDDRGIVVHVERLQGAQAGRDLRRMRIVMRQARSAAQDAVARIKPEIDRAMADFRAHEAEIRRVALLRPQLDAQIKAALAEARAQIALVRDEAIRAKADAALARAQAQIEQAAAGEAGGAGRIIVYDGPDQH